MATTRKYLGHLLQNTGITPACSEEERAAAEDLAAIFTAHGFNPEVQEFNASPMPRVMRAVLGIGLFVGAVLMGIGGAVGIIGTLIAVAMTVLYVLERMGKIALPGFGGAGVSQNVIAYHKAEGPLASPRNRPVVVVAHYDSPRADLFANLPYATYRPIITKLLPYAMVVPAILAVLRLFPFPPAAKAMLWILAIVAALVPLANAVGVIANRFVLPYTSGSVDNKSSVAALLGVMDAVAPYAGENEFPRDVPFDEYFSEQIRRAEEEELAAAIASGELTEDATEDAEAAADDEAAADAQGEELGGTAAMPVVDEEASVDLGATAAMDMETVIGATSEITSAVDEAEVADAGAGDDEDSAVEVEVAEAEGEDEDGAAETVEETEVVVEEPASDEPQLVNAYGNYRFGADVIRAIGMLPDSCVIEYEVEEPPHAEAVAEVAIVDEDARTGSRDAAEPAYEDESDDVEVEEDASYLGGEPMDDETDEYDDEAFEYESDFDAHPSAAQAGFASALSAVSSGAARLLSDMKRRGKDMLDSLSNHEAAKDEDADGGDEAAEDVETPQDTATEEASVEEVDVVTETAAEASADAEPVAEAEPAAEPAAAAQDEQAAEEPAVGATRAFDASELAANAPVHEEPVVDLGATVAQPPVRPQAADEQMETVDSLMAQINPPRPATPPRAPQRTFTSVPDPAIPSINQMNVSSRASLFDLPDPASEPVDPFASIPAAPNPAADASVSTPMEPAPSRAAANGFSVIGPDDAVEPVPYDAPAPSEGVFETISADAPIAPAPAAPARKRGLGKLFGGRKKRQEESMSDWLGVEDDFDAKRSGRDIGSWDNFEGDDWKGGATGVGGVSVDEMRDAVTSLGDDELLGHDIWFVATGASEFDNAGIDAFLDTHRDKLRGVFLINLESIGAGEPCMLATEGERRVLKGDKRIMNLVRRVSASFHDEFGEVEMGYLATDAYRAMERSLRSLTIAGVEDGRLACARIEDDLPYRVNAKNVNMVADVVTEVIRRS